MVGCEHMVLKVVLMTIKHGSLRGARLKSGEKSVGVAGESMPLVIEGVIMIQEWCTVEAEKYGNYGLTSELCRMTYDLGYEVPPKYTKVSSHVGDQLYCKTIVTLVFDKEDLPQLSFNAKANCFLYAREGVASQVVSSMLVKESLMKLRVVSIIISRSV
uniref:Uncharacterized protein n=1 Tax=Oryza sativa subsp. japonica TaxID=39947 RepID=Q6K2B7_ORYSJ|nr:hypothetical protein [Oryza sativa Japonica Group]BAD23699.1 hypothetical protein [Oryza sativa Japonica Group]